jgi:SAM-dependent methyltransferase/methyltransferase-like protein
MAEPTPNMYDEVPYPDRAVVVTHPGRLAMMAQLFGMEPAPIERCRVLELGCGAGGNLLPLAELFPESTFVGVDRAASSIVTGRAWADRVGVENLTFVEADLLTWDPGPEPFDYVIAHGVYSWVPDDVRERLMALFGRALGPRGVGYISYNALPGCYSRQMMRDMMRFHTRGFDDTATRCQQARAIAGFLADAVPAAGRGAYKAIMVGQRDRISELTDNYIIHDDLSDDWHPFYFHQFVQHAARHGLIYLAEARFAEMSDQALPPPVQEVLRGVGDVLAYEQYLDFVMGRAFRHTLLVRDGVALERQLDGSTLRRTFASAAAWPESDAPDLASPAVERFRNLDGKRIALQGPFVKTVMTVLAEQAPRAFSFDELLAAARDRLGATGEDDARELCGLLVMALAGEMVDLSATRARAVAAPGDHPRVTKLAREQAAAGLNLTTLYHQNVRDLDPFALRLLPLLDGTRDRAALAAETGGGPVDEALATLARRAFLVA